MRRLVSLAALGAAFLCLVSCEDFFGGEGSVFSKLRSFDFGYMSNNSKLAEIMGIEPNQFTPFTSEEDYRLTEEAGYSDPSQLKRNRFEFDKDVVLMKIQAVPSKAAIDGFEVVSSDPEVMEVVGYTLEGVKVKYHKLGDVDVTVTAKGSGRTIEKVFPLRIVGTVNVRFRITPFWLRKVATKIRMNTRSLPEGEKDLVMWTKDSVTVVGYCEWYDAKKHGRNMLVKRDTVTYPMEQFMTHYKKLSFYLLRDVTDAMRHFESMNITGTKIVENAETHKNDTVVHAYPYVAEQVILHWMPVCDNPYIEFLTTVKSKKTFDHYAEGQEPPEDWSEESDDVGDGEIEDDEEDDGEDDKEALNYFRVEFMDFTSQHEKDSLMNSLNDFKKEYGYDADLSDEEKDRRIDDINAHLDKDEQIKNAKKRFIRKGR
jgi:AAA ATPase containing von Willebrand factor type A (vWA) domain